MSTFQSTCFGHLRAHLQEDRLYIHHNWFNVISYDDCTVGRFVKDSVMCTVANIHMNLKTVCVTHVVFIFFYFLNADFYEGDTRCVYFLLVMELLNAV